MRHIMFVITSELHQACKETHYFLLSSHYHIVFILNCNVELLN